MIAIVIFFIILNIFLGKIDSKKINLGEVINHFKNGLYYSGMILLGLGILILTNFSVKFHPNNLIQIGQVILSLLLTRKIVFDISLNLFRKLKWNYISISTTSKIDQFENKIFKNNGTIKYGIYTTLLLINIILYYL